MLKPLTVWITTICGKFFKRWEYHTTLPASWEICMQVKKKQSEPDMKRWTGSKLGKEYVKTILSPCLFNLHAEYIMWNARLDESQAGVRTAEKNINNFRYADDTTLLVNTQNKEFLMIEVGTSAHEREKGCFGGRRLCRGPSDASTCE